LKLFILKISIVTKQSELKQKEKAASPEKPVDEKLYDILEELYKIENEKLSILRQLRDNHFYRRKKK
jgi:hypothetical protein